MLIVNVLYFTLKYQYFVVAEVVIAGGNDLFARFETFEHLVELRVLTADADLALHCLVSVRGYDIYPFSAGLLVECASWYKDSAFRLAELEVEVVGLTLSLIHISEPTRRS